MAYLLELAMLLIPYCLGKGVLRLLYRGPKSKGLTWADDLLTGWIIVIGLAEMAHLGAIIFGRSFYDCEKLFLAMLSVGTLISAIVLLSGRKKEKKYKSLRIQNTRRILAGQESNGMGQLVRWVLGIIVVLQVVLLIMEHRVYLTGDLTLETTSTILATGALHQMNPLTGNAYTLGLPLRWKILCLPTLYAILCDVSGLQTTQVVWVLVPIFTLLASYAAYSAVAGALFSEKDKRNSAVFLLLVAILFLSGSYAYGMDGFGVEYAGYRGVVIRNNILLPYLFSVLLRQKRILVILCILAEACMVWTLYGMGAGVFITAAMVVGTLVYHKLFPQSRKGEAE